MTLQRLLGTELPLIQAPMAGVQGSALALAGAGVAPLRAKAESQGSGDFSPLWSGQNASACREIPAGELTRALAADAAGRGG